MLRITLLGSMQVLLAVPMLLAGQQRLTVEPVADIVQDSKTEIKVPLRVKPADAPKLRFAVGKLRMNGTDSAIPKNLRLDSETGLFSWTPTPSQVGRYELTLTVADADFNEASTVLRITVRERPITAIGGKVGELLKKWHAEGTAAGNTGDFYDNRDRDHSALNRAMFPQLDEVMYTELERKLRKDWAAQHMLFPAVTFGNSSTSAPVTGGGSNIRMYYTSPRGMPFLYEQYRSNNLYIYPAHHDHHPGHNGKPFYGDVFPANSPYLIASQGSSGSDQPFMRAVPLTLAAFRPEVKKKLIETRLVVPTVQMILRICNKHLADPKEYLTGKAHPPVFEGSWVDDLKMIQMAHDMQPACIPPMIQLKVIDEDRPTPGKDYFEPAGVTEILADTPAAIARVVRSSKQVRRMVVSAEDSYDVDKHSLKFHWVVLRGDSRRIQIRPLNEAGSVVEILVPYHDRRPVDGHHLKIASNRVDIGAFVHNGTYWSAPGFITFHSLDNEMRTYDDQGKLLEIGYSPGDADLAISDWNAIFDLLNSTERTFPVRLMHEQFTAEQRDALAKTALEYRTEWDRFAAAQQKSKTIAEIRQKAQADLKAAVDKNAPPADREVLERLIKQFDADFQAAQKTVDAARKVVEAVLTVKQPGLDLPVRELIEGTLGRFKKSPTFYIDHRQEIDALAGLADDARKNRFAAAQRRLIALGILKNEAAAPQITPLKGLTPPAQKLTDWEKNTIERFNAEILATLVYPRLVTHNFRLNFVDFRLTTHKSWRDVYRHDSKGNVIGWTRNDPEKTTEFTAGGQMVLEKDTRGRAVRARTVRYQTDDSVKLPAVRPLTWLPGTQIVHYQYAGDDDYLGRIVKQEDAP